MRGGSARPGSARSRTAARVRPSAPGAPGGRPARRRTGAGGGGATARTTAPRPPGRFTGRAVVLGVVLLALALSYVFPVRVYLSQQAEIAEMEAAQQRQREHLARLEAEAARWEDDEYIRIQARKRLYFAEPGELLLITVWDDPQESTADQPEAPPASEGAWWDTLWASVESANHPAPPDQPAGPASGGAR